MTTEKTLDGKPHAGNPHDVFSQCCEVSGRLGTGKSVSARTGRGILPCKKMMQVAFLVTTYVFAQAQPCLAMEPRRVVVPGKAQVEFYAADGETLLGTGGYPVGQMYYDGGGINSSSAWGCLAGRAIYDVGAGFPSDYSPYSDEPAYGTKRTHHFFNGWKSNGEIIDSYFIVDPSVTRLESSWVEVDGEKTYYSVGGSIVACGLATGNGPPYNSENVTVQSISANATLYRGSVDYSGDIDEDALDDFLAAQDDGDAGDVVIWLSGSVSCYRYRKDIQTDGNGNVVNVMYDWKGTVEYHPDGPCTFDVGLVVTTASGHQWDRIELGSVTISSGFYGFNDSSSAGFKIRHTLSKSLFMRGESYKLTYEFNRSHSLRTPTYPSTTSIILDTKFPNTVVGSTSTGRFDVWVDSADAAVGSLTLKWNPPRFKELRRWLPLDKAKTDRILSGVTYSIYRSCGNENWTDVAKFNVNDTTKDGSDEFARDLECVADSCSGTTFTDTTFGTLGGNKPIHYIVVLNGGPMDARRNDTLPFLYGTAFGKVIARHRHSLSLGLSAYGPKEWKGMQHEHDSEEARIFSDVVRNFYDDPDYYSSEEPSYILQNSGCKWVAVTNAFEQMAKSPRIYPGDDVFFFLATHGNTNEVSLYDCTWTKSEITNCVAKFKDKGVRFIGIINACHSGAIINAFNTNEFGYTTWVAAAEEHMIASCYDKISGFGRVFLENGWASGYAKLDKVFSRNMKEEMTGASQDNDQLTLENVVKYTNLIWPGHSTRVLYANQYAPERCEQCLEMVRPEMQKNIVLRKVNLAKLQIPETPVPTIAVDDSGEQDKPLAKIAGIKKMSVNGLPEKSIYRFSYGSATNEWGCDSITSDRYWHCFLTPAQNSMINGPIYETDDRTPVFELDYSKLKGYLYHCLDPGRTYNVSVRALGPRGWGDASEHVQMTMSRDDEWLKNCIAKKQNLWSKIKIVLTPTARSVNGDITRAATLKTMTGKTIDLRIFATKDWRSDLTIVWLYAEAGGVNSYVDLTMGEDEDDPRILVAFNDDTGRLACDFGIVTAKCVNESGDTTTTISGRLAFDISAEGVVGFWGTSRFAGEISMNSDYPDDIEKEFGRYFESQTLPPEQGEVAPMKYCTVSFKPSGGMGGMEDQVFTIGEYMPLASNRYVRVGMEFLGWATSPYGSVVWPDGALASFDADTKLYARWSGDGGGESGSVSVAVKVAKGQESYGTVSGGGVFAVGELVALNVKVKTGNWFKGWYSENGTLVSTRPDFVYDTFNGNATFVAQFATKEDDAASLAIHLDERYTPGENGFFSIDLLEHVSSAYTEPTVSVSGLPPGLYFSSGFVYGWVKTPGVYPITVTVMNKSNTKGVSATLLLVVANEIPKVFADAGLVEGYVTSGVSIPELDAVLTSLVNDGWDVSIAGLPTGMRFDSETCSITGTATKEGSVNITITAEDSLEEEVATTTLTVRFPEISICVDSATDATGKVSGAGRYQIGKMVALKAVPDKGCVFAGWYKGDVFLSRSASFSYEMPNGDVILTAVFASTGNDAESLKVEVADDVPTEADGSLSLDLGECVESLSQPKLTVSGLPSGLKYDAKTGLISGKATKPGVYTVKVTATNASATGKNAVVKEFTVTVPNLKSELFTAAGLKSDESYVLQAGIAPDLKDVVAAVAGGGWKLAVSGLPSGVKYDAKSGGFTGVATKEGFSTVYFTATRGSGRSAEKQVATATFEVAFPTLALVVAAYDDASATNKATVVGGGRYPFGKKVTLKATAAKGNVFRGWYDGEGGLVAQTASYPYVTTDEDVTLTAVFVTGGEDKKSIKLCVADEEMRLAEDGSPHRTNVWAGVYLEWPVAAEALSATTIKVSGLPSGLKFTAKPVTGKVGTGKAAVTVTNVPANTIYGAPTAASKTKTDKKTGATTVTPSAVKVMVTTAGKSTQTYQIDTVVEALPAWAQGTFSGNVECRMENGELGSGDDGNAQAARSTSGTVSLTVSAAGKVSGKAQAEGLAYTLAAPYYSGFEVLTDGDVASGGETLVSNFLADVTVSWSYKAGSKTVKTNEVVQMTVRDNGVGGVAMGGSRPVATEVADATERVPPSWTAWQYNWAVDPWNTIGKSFDKKTIVYAILADGTFSESEEDVEAVLGAEVVGRVTLKFSAKGAVTVAGEFAQYDAKKAKYTTVKASGSATLVPIDGEHGAVFIYLTPKGLSPHARSLTLPWPEE